MSHHRRNTGVCDRTSTHPELTTACRPRAIASHRRNVVCRARTAACRDHTSAPRRFAVECRSRTTRTHRRAVDVVEFSTDISRRAAAVGEFSTGVNRMTARCRPRPAVSRRGDAAKESDLRALSANREISPRTTAPNGMTNRESALTIPISRRADRSRHLVSASRDRTRTISRLTLRATDHPVRSAISPTRAMLSRTGAAISPTSAPSLRLCSTAAPNFTTLEPTHSVGEPFFQAASKP